MRWRRYSWQDDGYYPVDQRDNRGIFWVMLGTMLLNFAATGVKMAAGVLTGSISVVADGLDSFFDGLSHVSGFAGLYAASKPPDAEHPYGHRKFETIAALSIAFLLFLTTYQLILTAWDRLRNPKALEINIWVILAMVVGLMIQGFTTWFEYRQGRRLKSEWLVADSYHTRASILVSLSVLGGLALVWLGFPVADPILAIVVALVIAKIGVDILRETLPVLVDRAPVDPQEIARVVESVPGVISFHRVRSRGTQDSAAVDLHVRVSPEMTIEQANLIGDDVRQRLLDTKGIRDVTVHLEPQREVEVGNAQIYANLQYSASRLGLRVHEAWTHRMDDQLYLETHVGVNPGLTLGQAHQLAAELEHELRHRLPEIYAVRIHIEMAVEEIQKDEPVTSILKDQVEREIEYLFEQLPGVCHPHNLLIRRIQGEAEGYYVSLECNLDQDLPIGEAHQLATQVEHELTRRLPEVIDVFVQLEPPLESNA